MSRRPKTPKEALGDGIWPIDIARFPRKMGLPFSERMTIFAGYFLSKEADKLFNARLRGGRRYSFAHRCEDLGDRFGISAGDVGKLIRGTIWLPESGYDAFLMDPEARTLLRAFDTPENRVLKDTRSPRQHLNRYAEAAQAEIMVVRRYTTMTDEQQAKVTNSFEDVVSAVELLTGVASELQSILLARKIPSGVLVNWAAITDSIRQSRVAGNAGHRYPVSWSSSVSFAEHVRRYVKTTTGEFVVADVRKALGPDLMSRVSKNALSSTLSAMASRGELLSKHTTGTKIWTYVWVPKNERETIH